MSDPQERLSTSGTPSATPSAEALRAPRRPPPELIVAVVLGYVTGVAQILAGIAVMFGRYLPDTNAAERLVVTVTGACVVLLGLFVITIASGLTRARRDARVLVTALLGVTIALDVVILIASPDLWFVIVDLVLVAAAITVLWTGRTARFFAHTSGGRTG
ncbi:hypothetical protein [Agromyces aureus]|uniref:Uncharacterized protein n=1 Tax=Agromyces aureus TaxID=453304 RepID=A0A191WCS2_9MICO|nr:hypothetical protein [Agromyces aureus]ANJ26065.1 hypothetical protein ATC03_04290 [Agromyces aureus]